MASSNPNIQNRPVRENVTPSPSKTSKLIPHAQTFTPSPARTPPGWITPIDAAFKGPEWIEREKRIMSKPAFWETRDKIMKLLLKRDEEEQAKMDQEGEAEKAKYAPSVESLVPNAPKSKKTKILEDGDVGCFLCDDGLWCPHCNPGDTIESGLTAPTTPTKAEAKYEPAHFHRTPGHERQAFTEMMAEISKRAQNGMPMQQDDLEEFEVMVALPGNWPAVKRRIEKWLTGVEESGPVYG